MTSTTELRARLVALEAMVSELSRCKAALGRLFQCRCVTGDAGRAYVHLETARDHVAQALADLEAVARDVEEGEARDAARAAVEDLRA